MRRLLAILAFAPACVPSYDFAGQGAADASEDVGLESAAREPSPDASDANASPDVPAPPGVDGAAEAGAPGVSLQDCVLLMHFEEASWSGAGSVKDDSGQGNHGSPIGAVAPTANGKFGRAALFDGASYIDVLDSATLHATTALTLSAWIHPTALAPADAAQAYPGIVSKRTDFGVSVEYTMFLWTGDALWGDLQGTAASYRFNSIFSFTNGPWYHVAIVFDGSLPNAMMRTNMYVNGMLDSQSAGDTSLAAPPATPPDLLIGYLNQGGRNPDVNAFFTGAVDEVAIWRRALGPSEILALARAMGPL